MSNQSFLGLPPIPPELKPITSFIQRADELKVQDPVIAYWCAYYAAQEGIAIKATAPANAKFLSSLISVLEGLRGTIGPSDAVDVESVSSVYVEDFALRVFNVADNEDRSGKATRGTAKKFLAAATFLEVLKIFEDKSSWESHADKARYARWKAADIAKAFREGRAPNPGPAGSNPNLADPAFSSPSSLAQSFPLLPSSTDTLPPAASSSTATSVSPSQMARFDTTGSDSAQVAAASDVWSTRSTDGNPSFRAESGTLEDEGFSEGPFHPRKLSPPSSITSPLPPVGEEDAVNHHGTPSPSSSVASSSSSKRRRSRASSISHAAPSIARTSSKPQNGQERARTSSMSSASSQSTTSGRSLNRTSSPTHFVPRDVLVSTSANSSPLSQPASVISPSSFSAHQPSQAYSPPQPYSPPSGSPYSSVPPPLPQQPRQPSGPPYAPASPYAPALPPPPLRQPNPLPELTSSMIAKAQKHCRFAISALDYEDADQARKELRAALQLLGDV